MLFKTFAAAALVATVAALPGSSAPSYPESTSEPAPVYSSSSVVVAPTYPASGAPSYSSVPEPIYSTEPPAESYPETAEPTYPASVPATTEPAPTYPATSEAAPTYPAVSSAPVVSTSAAPWYPYGSVSGSVCVETSTQIWRSTTAVVTYSVTAASGWAAPSGTGAWVASSTWAPPATGGASSPISNIKAAGIAGLAVFVGAAAVLL